MLVARMEELEDEKSGRVLDWRSSQQGISHLCGVMCLLHCETLLTHEHE